MLLGYLFFQPILGRAENEAVPTSNLVGWVAPASIRECQARLEAARAALPVDLPLVARLMRALASLRDNGSSGAGTDTPGVVASPVGNPADMPSTVVRPLNFALAALGHHRKLDLTPILLETGIDPPGATVPAAAYQAVLDYDAVPPEFTGNLGRVEPFRPEYLREFAVAPGAQYIAFTFSEAVFGMAGTRHFADAVIIGKVNPNGLIEADHYRLPLEAEPVYFHNPAFLGNGARLRVCVSEERTAPPASIRDIFIYPTKDGAEVPPQKLSGLFPRGVHAVKPLGPELYLVATAESPRRARTPDGHLYLVHYDATLGRFSAPKEVPQESAWHDAASLEGSKLELLRNGIAWIRLPDLSLIRWPLDGGIVERRAERSESAGRTTQIVPLTHEDASLSLVIEEVVTETGKKIEGLSGLRGPERRLIWALAPEMVGANGDVGGLVFIENAAGLVAFRQGRIVRVINVEQNGAIVGEWWLAHEITSLEGLQRIENGFYLPAKGAASTALFLADGVISPVGLVSEAGSTILLQGAEQAFHYLVELPPNGAPQLRLGIFRELVP